MELMMLVLVSGTEKLLVARTGFTGDVEDASCARSEEEDSPTPSLALAIDWEPICC